MTPPRFTLPRGACDCHVHIFGNPAQFPMAPGRVYTPPEAPLDALLDLHRALGLERVVLIQPSVYGSDNSAMLDALRHLGPERARAVAVIDESTLEAALEAMRSSGVRGIRINLETVGQHDPAVARAHLLAAMARCRPLGWHIQLYTKPAIIAALRDDLAASPVPIVLDHFGGADAALGPAQPGFDAVLALVRSGKANVKLSAPYRESANGPPYDNVGPLAKALVAANPDCLLWGSDWPHPDGGRVAGRAPTDISPFLPIDDGLVLNLLPGWIPDAAIRRKILVDNPARLYGF
jgi:predicted TIM-barrel fold metal-dependent hydrolase